MAYQRFRKVANVIFCTETYKAIYSFFISIFNGVAKKSQPIKAWFFKDLIHDELFEQPCELLKIVHTQKWASLGKKVVLWLFVLCYTFGNYLLESGFTTVCFVFYILYRAEDSLDTFYRAWNINRQAIISNTSKNSVSLISGIILDKVRGNVLDEEDGKYVQATEEKITNCVANYSISLWELSNAFWFNFGDFVITVFMLLVTIFTNKSIPQKQFIPLILITIFLCLFTVIYDRFYSEKYFAARRRLRDDMDTVKHDLVKKPAITSADITARLRRFKAFNKQSVNEEININNKSFRCRLLLKVVHFIASSTLIILFRVNNPAVTLKTVTVMFASLKVFDTIVHSFEDIVFIATDYTRNKNKIKSEMPLLKKILSAYSKSISEEKQVISSLQIPKFSITYNEASENDKPFTLSLSEDITYNMGDRIVLTGASGSGKSTFLKICTKRIMFKNISSANIIPVNYMYYDDNTDFGSMNLWTELFCLDSTVRIEPSKEEVLKMEEIMKGLKIYQELSENCADLWVWLSQHQGKELSRGQKQRLIVAKILFWLDENIDIVALDECTSGLDAESTDSDNADAISVLKFIIDYCNRDKDRILFLATHQDISSLCNHQLHFKRKNGETKIEYIN